jgi:hypothetical protein
MHSSVQVKEISIWIPVVFPSRNESERAARSSKFAGASLKKKYTKLAVTFIGPYARRGWTPLQRYSVSFLWVCKDKRHDPDNVMAGMKFVFDGMVAAGLVADDRWENVQKIENRFAVCKSNPGVRINVIFET